MKTLTKAKPAPVTTQSIAVIKKQATTLSNEVETFTVKSAEDVEVAMEVLGNIAKATKGIEAQQKVVIDKLKDLQDIEKGRWKPSLDLLKAADKKLREDVMAFRNAETERLKVAEAKVLAKVTTGKIKNPVTAMSKITAIQSIAMNKSVGNGSFKAVKKLKIVNADQIPREYMAPDEAAIKTAFKQGVKVPGCTWTDEETLAVRQK